MGEKKKRVESFLIVHIYTTNIGANLPSRKNFLITEARQMGEKKLQHNCICTPTNNETKSCIFKNQHKKKKFRISAESYGKICIY